MLKEEERKMVVLFGVGLSLTKISMYFWVYCNNFLDSLFVEIQLNCILETTLESYSKTLESHSNLTRPWSHIAIYKQSSFEILCFLHLLFIYLFILIKKMFLITFIFFPLKFLIRFNSSLSSPTFISTHTNYYAFYFNIFFLSHLSLLVTPTLALTLVSRFFQSKKRQERE